MTATILDSPSAPTVGPDTSRREVELTVLHRSLRRYRDLCIVLVLVLFFGRSLWAWLAGRSWIVGPDLAGLYVLGFPALFLMLGRRDLLTCFRLWRSRRQAHARREDSSRRPWQYVTAGAVLGALVILGVTAVMRMLG